MLNSLYVCHFSSVGGTTQVIEQPERFSKENIIGPRFIKILMNLSRHVIHINDRGQSLDTMRYQ